MRLIFGLFLILSVSVIGEQTGVAEDNRGISALGLCSPHFDCDGFIETVSALPVIRTGWLDNTFADDCACAKRLLQLPNPKEVRIHLLNGPGLRNKRLGSYEVLAGETISSAEQKIRDNNANLMGKIDERLSKLKDLLSGAKDTKVLISTCLECNFSKPVRRILEVEAGAYFPDATFVDNPLTDSCLENFVCEYHGRPQPRTRGYIVDMDGADVFDDDPEAYAQLHKDALVVYGWTYSLNGNTKNGTFQDPRSRKNFTRGAEWAAFSKWLGAKNAIEDGTTYDLTPLEEARFLNGR